MLSSAFGIITIMMMIVTSKIREIGVIRAIGSNKIDVMIIFLLQGSIIGAMEGSAWVFARVILCALRSDLKPYIWREPVAGRTLRSGICGKYCAYRSCNGGYSVDISSMEDYKA